jgi:hypothetical protein
MSSDEIKAGSKVTMTHAQRQAFLKTSPLGQLFGVADLLLEVEEMTSNNHTSTQSKVVHSEQVFKYEGRGKWSRSLPWKQVHSYVKKRSSQRKTLVTV